MVVLVNGLCFLHTYADSTRAGVADQPDVYFLEEVEQVRA
jgi:hypothetical protein